MEKVNKPYIETIKKFDSDQKWKELDSLVRILTESNCKSRRTEIINKINFILSLSENDKYDRMI